MCGSFGNGKGDSPYPRTLSSSYSTPTSGSRAKALEVIGKYNALVERYNRLNDDMSTATSEQLGDSDEKAQHNKVDYEPCKAG